MKQKKLRNYSVEWLRHDIALYAKRRALLYEKWELQQVKAIKTFSSPPFTYIHIDLYFMHRRNETKKLKNSLNLIKGRTGCAFVTIFILNKHCCDESARKTNYKLPSHLAPRQIFRSKLVNVWICIWADEFKCRVITNLLSAEIFNDNWFVVNFNIN